MTKKKAAGLTEGFATLEIIKGFKFLNVNAQVFKSPNKSHDPTDRNDDKDAEYQNNFDGDVLPKQRTILRPVYLTAHETYWLDEPEILYDIVDALKLRYPESHPEKPLKIIKSDEVYPQDYGDFFFDAFKHDTRFQRMMEGGRYTFRLEDPADRLLFYSMKNSPYTQVEGEEVSKYMKGTIKYKLIMPGYKEEKNAEIQDKDIEAISKLSKKNGISGDKQKMIAHIMGVRDIDTSNPDPENLRIQLKMQVASSLKPSKIPGMTQQDWFIELSNTPPAKLTKQYFVHKALSYNIIVRQGDKFRFNEVPVEGVIGLPALIEYYLDPANANQYGELTDLVESRDAQLDPNGNIG